ncbi:MAG: hypothetical protein OEY19_13355 [Gammaproteobacteria bacterium]|nr:hypothetical protein [Gammaproteobacteria bacterium]
MSNSIDKNINAGTIKDAHWFVLLGLVLFIGSCYFVEPNFLVFTIALPYGLFVGFGLPFLWRRNYNSIGGWLNLGFVIIILPKFFENSWHSLQVVSLSVFLGSLIWLILKHRLISYVENNDNK